MRQTDVWLFLFAIVMVIPTLIFCVRAFILLHKKETRKKARRSMVFCAISFVIIVTIIIYSLVMPYSLKLSTKTTATQSEAIDLALQEQGIRYEKIYWSEVNRLMSNEGVYEYYDIIDSEGNTYLLTLGVPDKDIVDIKLR